MAQNLQQLKRRIKTAQNISKIARAMEMISASKIKRAQKAVESNKPYHARIVSLTSSMLKHANLSKFKHSYLSQNDSEKTLLFAVSTDKGLCGSLNTNMFKRLIELDNKNVKLVTIGKKGNQFAQRLDAEIIATFPLGTTLPDYSIVFNLIEIIHDEFVTGKVSKVALLYNQFDSIFAQSPTVKEILPIQPLDEEEAFELPYIFEPKAQEILESLLPYYLEVVLYSAIIEAYTSEQAARMVAMQNAKNNARDIADYLTLVYNKSRQEKITSELLSLTAN